MEQEAKMEDVAPNCVFCKIARGEDPKTEILYQDDSYVVFRDIRPATSHHYLVITKRHIKNPKYLTAQDCPVVEEMVRVGKQLLEGKGGDIHDIRLGFHWPPFNSISHLHLHVISSTKEMGWISRMIFKPGSYWFYTSDAVLQHLQALPSQ